MQKLVAIFLIAILAGSVTIPDVFSDSENEQNTESDSHQNDNQGNQNNAQENENDNHGNQNETKNNDDHGNNKDNETKIHFGFSNATSVNITLPNGTTITFGFSNETNVGQQISAFIHQIREAFKQQETQAKQIIKDCREKAKEASNPADRKNIMNECKAQLKQINQQFSSEHKQLQLDFKQFRDMVIGNNQENHEDSPGQKGNTIIQNTAQFVPTQHGLGQIKSHGKQNNTMFQNTAQLASNQHGQQHEHGKQNGKQKHGRED